MEAWISLREFARQRGVTLAAVQKAIASGRVTAVRRDANERISGIELHRATAQWNAMTDPAQSARSTQSLELSLAASSSMPTAGAAAAPGASQPAAAPSEAQPAPSESPAMAAPDVADRDPHGYHAHRAEREKFEAKKAELAYLEAIGALVSADEVRTLGARRYRAARDAILAVPDQEAAILAVERDPVVIRERLMVALRKALHGLADEARTEAAGGTAERMAA